MEKTTPFHTSIYFNYYNMDNAPFVEACYSLKNRDSGVSVSNFGGWQSNQIKENDVPEFKSIIDLVQENVKSVYVENGILKEPELGSMWVNINKKHDYNLSHSHGSSFFSAVFYLKTPPDSGRIAFERPDGMRKSMVFDELNPNNVGVYYVQPAVGLLVVFPSYLSHYVEQSMADEDRISLAFNYR